MVPRSIQDDLALKRCDRLLIIFSDIEMGAGGPVDDFPHSDFLAGLIRAYGAGLPADLMVDLVFNGDTFDFLKTSVDGGYPHHINAAVALAKFSRIATAHEDFFLGLREFLEGGVGNRRVHFVVGNHDAELAFGEVQHALRAHIGAEGVNFPGYHLDIGDVHIEHGQQRDPMFRVDSRQPLVHHEGEMILNLSWGAVALLEVAMPMQAILHQLDRLKPRNELMELLPEVRELLVERYYRYWTRGYWKGFFKRNSPVKRPSWTMFREVAHRFNTRDAEVREDAPLEQLLMDGPHRVVVAGHTHRPGLTSFGNRRLLRSGCFRNEMMLEDQGRKLTPLPKVFVEITMLGDRALHADLVEVDGPPPPPEHIPESIYDVLPEVRRLLGTEEQRRDAQEGDRAQMEKEANGDD